MIRIILYLLCFVMLLGSISSCASKKSIGGGSSSSEQTSDSTSVLNTTDNSELPPESFPDLTDEDTDPVTTEDNYEPIFENGGFTYEIDIRPYLQYICTGHSSEYLVIANRKHPLGKNYKPKDLVKVMSGSQWYLRKAAKEAFEAMRLEMQKLKVYDTYNRSTYRSYSFQNTLYTNNIAKERKKYPHLSTEELMNIVDTYSARPGTSDHQTGLTIDFHPLEEYFEGLKAFKYMKNNAHKFGFILRYPKGKTYITGYTYEPWHWRFVGREAATYIYEHDLTLEEYMAQLNGTEIETFPETTPIPPVTKPQTTTTAVSDTEPDTTVSDTVNDDPEMTSSSTSGEDEDPEMTSSSTSGEEEDPEMTSSSTSGEEEDDPEITSSSTSGEEEDPEMTSSSTSGEDEEPEMTSSTENEDPNPQE